MERDRSETWNLAATQRILLGYSQFPVICEVYLRQTMGVTLMADKDFSSALIYHEATKHSEVSIGASAHYLDWDNKPAQFKEYKNLASIALPRNFPRPKENSISAIKGETKDAGAKQIDIGALSELLFFSAGLTRKMRFGKEFYYMRAASATGALYPIDLYVIQCHILRLEAGGYHFNPLHFSLA